jgi:hypothetical protein
MTHRTRIAALAVAIGGFLTIPVLAEAQVVWANVRTQATIEAIDVPTRTLTLRGSQGNLTEHRVPDDIMGFSELERGDRVKVLFLHQIGLHLRAAGAPAPDLSKLSVPGGGPSVMRTMAAEVSEIDPTVPAVSIKSSSGEQATFRLPKGMSLQDFPPGSEIDVTYVIPEEISVSR